MNFLKKSRRHSKNSIKNEKENGFKVSEFAGSFLLGFKHIYNVNKNVV